jgi:hypothetical protein
MVRMIVVSAVLLPILGGCAAPSAQMANNKGQVAGCRAVGFGVLGTLAAVSMYQTCVNEYQKQGFHQVAARPASATAPAAATAKPKANSATSN